jgi:hypothetical protein
VTFPINFATKKLYIKISQKLWVDPFRWYKIAVLGPPVKVTKRIFKINREMMLLNVSINCKADFGTTKLNILHTGSTG